MAIIISWLIVASSMYINFRIIGLLGDPELIKFVTKFYIQHSLVDNMNNENLLPAA